MTAIAKAAYNASFCSLSVLYLPCKTDPSYAFQQGLVLAATDDCACMLLLCQLHQGIQGTAHVMVLLIWTATCTVIAAAIVAPDLDFQPLLSMHSTEV